MGETVKELRNIALVGHGHSGKTSVAEAILYNGGSTNRLGRVDDGSSLMDFEPEEIRRKTSISASFHQCAWNKHVISITDTPGDANFFSDTRNCLQGTDSVVLVVEAVDGVKVQTEQAWELANQLGHPVAVFINKIDRERADFFKTVEEIKNTLGCKLALLQLPVGVEDDFNGIVDLITQKAYFYDGNGKATAGEIPAELMDRVESEREVLAENIAETDDELVEKYLDGQTLTEEELLRGLRTGTLKRAFVPVLCGSATRNIGIDLLMSNIIRCMPSPSDRGEKTGIDPKSESGVEAKREPDPNEPFSALVFKTVADAYAGRLSILRIFSGTLHADSTFYNASKETKERFGQLLRIEGKEQSYIDTAVPGEIVAIAKLKETTTGDTVCDEAHKIKFKTIETPPALISFAISPKTRGDEEKVFTSVTRLLEEDTSLRLTRNAETKQTVIQGMGQLHIEAVMEKLKRKFGVEAVLDPPRIPYKETIKKAAKGIVYRHKKQSGGRGQFAEVHLDVSPNQEGHGFEFEEDLTGMNVPRNFVPAVEKGILESLPSGVLAGYPVIDVKVRFYDGKSHEVDSSEMAFKIASSMCFKKAMEEAKPTLLEPIMNVTVTVREDYMGDVIGDLNSRRGRVLGMEAKGKNQIIRAQVPMSEILRYAPDLTSITGGRGSFTTEFARYEEAPAHVIQKVVEKEKQEKE